MRIYDFDKTKSSPESTFFSIGSSIFAKDLITETTKTERELYYFFVQKKILLAIHTKQDKEFYGAWLAPEKALLAPRLQYNFSQRTFKKQEESWNYCYNFILIDIDNFNYNKFDIENLPIKPQVIIKNPKKTHSIQLIYWLDKANFARDEDITKQFRYVQKALTTFYSGDLNNVGFIAKNPFSSEHLVHFCENAERYSLNHLYTLCLGETSVCKDEFREIRQLFIEPKNQEKTLEINDLESKKRYGNYLKLVEQADDSRNKQIFLQVQNVAKQYIADYYDLADGKKLLFQFLLGQINDWLGLEKDEVEKIVRSNVRYFFRTYDHAKRMRHFEKNYFKINEVKREKLMKRLDYIRINYDYKKRFTLAEKEVIAKQMKIAVSTLENYLHMLRIEDKVSNDDICLKIKELRDKKTRWGEIAKIFGKTENALKSLYKRFNQTQAEEKESKTDSESTKTKSAGVVARPIECQKRVFEKSLELPFPDFDVFSKKTSSSVINARQNE